MNLTQFFSACNSQSLNANSVVLFGCKQYPALFFSTVLSHLRNNYPTIPKKIIFEGVPFSSIQGQFSTTFLGQKEILWLGDISAIEDASVKKQLLQFLGSYKGPHVLIGSVHSDDWKHASISLIMLEEPVSESDRALISSFLFPQIDLVKIKDLMKYFPKSSLDQMLLLMQYIPFLGKNSTEFNKQWLPKLIATENSLFELSQYFFGLKTVPFWNAWHALKDDYAGPFWTTYWSEQLWRASMVVGFYQQNKIIEAKQLAFRLPFSFIQRDWKLHSVESLRKAHAFLYEGDCALKNGNSEFFLDCFYSSFLNKQF